MKFVYEIDRKEEMKIKPIRIDADDIRELFEDIGYNGRNSYVFQKACSIGVHKLFNHVQEKKLHAIIDGTFATNNSMEDVSRALGRNIKVFIYYIHQDPIVAWEIAKGRENIEGRSVPKKAFIDSYFKSRENVNRVKKEFLEKVELNLIIKNVERNLEKQILNIDHIDFYVKKIYNKSELMKVIL